MLNKENTKKAEQIAEQLKPLFYRAYELGRIYDNTRNQQENARTTANAWQWRKPYECERAGLDRETLENIIQNNPKQWHEELEKAYKNQHKRETAHTCAFINFKNYLDYMAHFIGDLIRPYWREFVERQGLATLGEIINKLNPKKGDHTAGDCSAFIYCRGGDLYPDHNNPENWTRLEVCIYTGWACGISGRYSSYYTKNPAEVWENAEILPLITPAKMETNKAKIKKYIDKAETIRAECQKFAKSCGLLGFVEIITEIKKGQ